MRIALATGLLPVPPTYFALQHGARLADEHAVRMFALATHLRDARLGVAIDSVIPAVGPWPARMATAFVSAPLAFRLQARAITAFAPDVVHQHFATWSRGAIEAGRQAGAPLVTTLHGYDVFAAERHGGSPLARFHRRNAEATARDAQRVLAVSRYLADRAIAAGFPAARMHVHYQGVDTDVFTPSPTRQASAEPSLVFVGALAERKGVRDLVEASIDAAGRAPHRLRIIGDGPLAPLVRAAAAEHPHIDVMGGLPRSRVIEVLREARALVLPTQEHQGWREAAGLVLLEAQACGVPVVVYRSGGAPEMVEDEATGAVVAEGDRRALSSAMVELLGLSEAEHSAMSARARQFVVESRSLSRSVTELREHYLAALEG